MVEGQEGICIAGVVWLHVRTVRQLVIGVESSDG